MKLASLQSPNIGGQLIIVNKSLNAYVKSPSYIPTMQFLLDHWEEYEKVIAKLYDELNAEKIKGIPLDVTKLLAPLPRSYQWLDGSAFVHHVELARKSRGAEMPDSFWTDPLMYQGASDFFYEPISEYELVDEAYGLDFEAELVVITGFVKKGSTADETKNHAILFGMINDWSLRNLIPNEISKGFGFLQSKPHCCLAPFFLSKDEFGTSFQGGKLNIDIECKLNQNIIGKPNASTDMVFNFYELIAHASKTRDLNPGTIIGSGTVSNKDSSKGSCCLVEKRMLEILQNGKATTPYLKRGDLVQIRALLDDKDVFGEIKNKVV